jgi:glycosyltransferase involved in cell wall biosynthesis
MRIVYLLTSLGMGGAERQVLSVAERMAVRGHTVALLVLRGPVAEEWPTELETIRLDMRRNPFSVFSGLAHGRRYLRGFHADVVHSHSFHANFVARLLRLMGSNAPVLSTVHNVYEGGWHRMLAYRLTDFLSARTAAVSAAAAERFVRLKAVPAAKCIVVPNGIDTSEFAADAARRAATRAAMNAGDNFIWITAGRLTPAKDFPNLLRAFKTVRITNPQVELWIAGEGKQGGTKEFVVVSGSFENVRWLGLRRDIPALMDAADGFVLASAWEGMPLVVGEAMAMEKPVVATDVGGVRELVGEAGMLVQANDSEALGQAMLAVMRQNEADRRRAGRAARARIAECFSIETRVEQWEKIHGELMQGTSNNGDCAG